MVVWAWAIALASCQGLCTGLWISWKKIFEDISENKFNPFVVLVQLDHQEEHLELKSPVTTDEDGLPLFMSFKNFWNLDKNMSNLSGTACVSCQGLKIEFLVP